MSASPFTYAQLPNAPDSGGVSNNSKRVYSDDNKSTSFSYATTTLEPQKSPESKTTKNSSSTTNDWRYDNNTYMNFLTIANGVPAVIEPSQTGVCVTSNEDFNVKAKAVTAGSPWPFNESACNPSALFSAASHSTPAKEHPYYSSENASLVYSNDVSLNSHAVRQQQPTLSVSGNVNDRVPLPSSNLTTRPSDTLTFRAGTTRAFIPFTVKPKVFAGKRLLSSSVVPNDKSEGHDHVAFIHACPTELPKPSIGRLGPLSVTLEAFPYNVSHSVWRHQATGQGQTTFASPNLPVVSTGVFQPSVTRYREGPDPFVQAETQSKNVINERVLSSELLYVRSA